MPGGSSSGSAESACSGRGPGVIRTTRCPRSPKRRQHARAHDRGLAASGRPDQGDERVPLHDGEAGGDLGVAAEEPLGVADVVRHEARPRAPVRAGTDDRDGERGILPQDRLLEGDHARGGVDAELARQDRPEPPDRAECLTLRADAVLRQGEQLPAAFAQRGRLHHLVRARQDLRGAAALELGIEQQLLGVQPQLLQASRLAARGRPLRELLVGLAPPELESLLQHERGPVGLAELQQLTPTRDLHLEPAGVELVEGDGEAVPSRRRLDGSGPQSLPESDHARLEVLGGRSRRMVAPHSVDQLVRGHRLPQPGDQRLEHDAVAGAETCEAVDGQRTEDCDPHATTVLPQ